MKRAASAIALLGLLVGPLAASAQTTQSLAVSPLTFELNANPGEQLSNVIQVTNNNDVAVTANIDIEDFAPAGELGQVVVTEPGENQNYSLARWISVDAKTFPLAPHETHQVVFTINVPANAEPGGHYGTILSSISSGPSTPGGVGVATKVGALLLLHVAGQAKEALSVASFTAPNFSEYGPVTITTRIQNEGNVHLKPYGFILVQDMFGHEVDKIALDQLNVLPGSIRRIDSSFGSKWLIGKYTATLTAVYGTQSNQLSYVTSFWVLPWKVLGVGLIVTILILILLIRARHRIGLALRILFRGDSNGRG